LPNQEPSSRASIGIVVHNLDNGTGTFIRAGGGAVEGDSF